MRLFPFLFLFCFVGILHSQTPVPAPPQKSPILIMGAKAHLGNGTVIENSAIGFDNGVFTLVADATTIRLDRTKYSKIYDATGKHVYPGFIAPNATVGLVEIDQARETIDFVETGSMNPNARALVAYNADSDIPPTLRTNGVLMAQITPDGGVISGTSSVVQMDAWNWEDATVRADDGVHLNWPAPRVFPGIDADNPEQKKNDPYDKEIQALHRFFGEAKAYCLNKTPEVKNQRFESMRGLFALKQTLYIHVSNARTMQEAVLFAEQYGVHPVLVEARDAWMIPEFLKAHAVSVILDPTQRLPSRVDEDVDQPFKTAATLYHAGVPFAFTSIGSWRQRNLPFQAGQAVGFGLPYEAAVSAITLNAAKILEIDGTVGSIQVGKEATLFISEGDALDMRTCKVTAVFIQGREVNLDNKQKELAKKFGGKW
jgi:imidazolonepropionase-like amidohydrolase